MKDKVMLAFWICLILMIAIGIAVLYGMTTDPNRAHAQEANVAMDNVILNIVVQVVDKPDMGFQDVNVREDADGALHIYRPANLDRGSIWIASFRPNGYLRWFEYQPTPAK